MPCDSEPQPGYDIAPDRKTALVSQLFKPDSPMRWSWEEFGLYQIADTGAYAERMRPFAAFYSAFYQRARVFDLDPSRQFDIFDFPEFDITIVGFSSCYNNDILNKQNAWLFIPVASALWEGSYANRTTVAGCV